MIALIDADVLLKGACFGILQPLVGRHPAETGVLGASRYVLPPKIRRLRPDDEGSAALGELSRYIELATELEPTEPEVRLAADLELLAQTAGLELDVGESQLCAVLVMRTVPALLTGDKRAIYALDQLLDLEPRISRIAGRVYCLEQLFAPLLSKAEVASVREAVCREPVVDRTLAICFSCSTTQAQRETILQGLSSYVRSVRATARRVLAADP